MTTSSEDVLLQINEVRFKKGDGTLYAMDKRLAWIPEGRDTVQVSHLYKDIKSKFATGMILAIDSYFPAESFKTWFCFSPENITCGET